MKKMNVAIVGSRDYINYENFLEKLENILEKKNIEIKKIISGGEKGCDKLAEKYAEENNIKTKIFLPNYDIYGKRAPLERNTLIVNKSDIIIAFPSRSSRGTFDTIRKARDNNKILYILYI